MYSQIYVNMETIKGLVKNNEWKHPWYCLNHRTNLCNKRKDWICKECKNEISEVLKTHHSKMSLDKRSKLNQREQFEYFFHNQLRRKNWYKNYSPRLRNILSSAKNLSKLECRELELGQIYEVFEKFIEDMIKRYKFEHNLWVMEDDDFLKSFYKSDSVSDFVHYNILDRNFSFNILGESEVKNTSFKIYEKMQKTTDIENTEKHEETPPISELKITINDNIIPVNSIEAFYIKNKEYETLSDQIENLLEKVKNDIPIWNYKIPATEENIKAIKKYLKRAKYIEWICKSEKYLADSYIEGILIKLLNNITKLGNKWTMKIASNKNPQRATEKIIKDYDWDLSKLRDISRASMLFDTPLDLVTGAVEFVETLEKYNQSEQNPQKKITDISFISKFWYPRTSSQKNSWYRDAKFLLKIWDWNIIEIQFHIKSLLKAKYQWISKARNKTLVDIIKMLNFTPEEYEKINNLIDSIDWKSSGKIKPEYFDNVWEHHTLSSDQVYSIYRLLNDYDRKNNDKPINNIWKRLWKIFINRKEHFGKCK